MKVKTVVIAVTYDERVRYGSRLRIGKSEQYQDDFRYRVGPEPSYVANVLTPAVVKFGEPSTIYTLLKKVLRPVPSAAHTRNQSYTKDPKNQEKQ